MHLAYTVASLLEPFTSVSYRCTINCHVSSCLLLSSSDKDSTIHSRHHHIYDCCNHERDDQDIWMPLVNDTFYLP